MRGHRPGPESMQEAGMLVGIPVPAAPQRAACHAGKSPSTHTQLTPVKQRATWPHKVAGAAAAGERCMHASDQVGGSTGLTSGTGAALRTARAGGSTAEKFGSRGASGVDTGASPSAEFGVDSPAPPRGGDSQDTFTPSGVPENKTHVLKAKRTPERGIGVASPRSAHEGWSVSRVGGARQHVVLGPEVVHQSSPGGAPTEAPERKRQLPLSPEMRCYKQLGTRARERAETGPVRGRTMKSEGAVQRVAPGKEEACRPECDHLSVERASDT